MPLTFERDDARRRVTVTAVGAISLEESLRILDRQADEGVWDYAVLYDGRGRDGTLDSSEIVRVVSRTAILSKRHGPVGPLAIVRLDPAGFSVGRMFEVFSGEGGRIVRVFRSMDDANTWLEQLPSTGSHGPSSGPGAPSS